MDLRVYEESSTWIQVGKFTNFSSENWTADTLVHLIVSFL